MTGGLVAIMAVVFAAGGGGSASEQEPADARASAAQVAQTQEKDEDKVVCKRIVPTGTRLGGERVCKPKSWWEDVRNRAQQGLGQHQQRGLQANSGGT